jgi:hypothetical protein
METNMSLERLVRLLLFVLTLAVALGVNCAKIHAQEALFIVRGAEPKLRITELTDAGEKKAEALARLLMDADIDVIYAFDRGFLIKTAEPTAKVLKKKVNILPLSFDAMDDLVRRLRTQHASQRVFIVALHLRILFSRLLGLRTARIQQSSQTHCT